MCERCTAPAYARTDLTYELIDAVPEASFFRWTAGNCAGTRTRAAQALADFLLQNKGGFTETADILSVGGMRALCATVSSESHHGIAPPLCSQSRCEQSTSITCCGGIYAHDCASGGHADYNAYWYEEAMQTLYNATLTNLEPPSAYSTRLPT